MNRRGALALLTGLALLPLAARALQADAPVKALYHLVEGKDQAMRALGNIRNHLRAAPGTRIAVVAHGNGIEFLLAGASDRNGRAFAPQVAELIAEGVDFRLCRNTLTAHDVPESRVLPGVQMVPSGVAEIARLQAREGYVYLRP